MFHKRARIALLVVLLMAVVMVTTSCEKFRLNRLKANYWFSKANSQFTEGAFRQAIEEYEKALQYDPQLVQAYRFLGEAYKELYKPGIEGEENQRRANEGLKALEKAYEIDPNNKDVLYSLGDMYDMLERFEDAEKLYLKIIEMEPTNMGNYYIVAEFYKKYAARVGNNTNAQGAEQSVKTPFDKALEMYLRRIETDPDNEQGYAYIAQFYEELTPTPDFESAYEYQLKRTILDPENAAAWLSVGVNRWGKAYRLQNQLTRQERLDISKQGEEALLKATELDPAYPEPYSWLSVLYRSVLSKIDPDRARRYEELADRYAARFQEARNSRTERKKLEEELGNIR